MIKPNSIIYIEGEPDPIDYQVALDLIRTGDWEEGSSNSLGQVTLVRTKAQRSAEGNVAKTTSSSGAPSVNQSPRDVLTDMFGGVVKRVGIVGLVALLLYVLYRNRDKFADFWHKLSELPILGKVLGKLDFINPNKVACFIDPKYSRYLGKDYQITYDGAELDEFLATRAEIESLTNRSLDELVAEKIILDSLDPVKALKFLRVSYDGRRLEARPVDARAIIHQH